MDNKTSRRSFLVSSLGSALVWAADGESTVQLMKAPNGGLQPQAVADSRGVIHVIYLYGDPAAADIGYVRKPPGGRDFSPPIRVNSALGSAIALGSVRGAHLALGRFDRIHVAWNGSSKAEPKGPRSSAPMLYARLNDRRDGFEPQRNLMTIASGLDGGGTLAADTQGNVYVTWHAQGQENGNPIEGEEHRRVWLTRSVDDGRRFEKERPVSPAELGACGCCGMGAVDVHPWQIGACPMSTVSLALANGRVLLSWETESQVYFAPVNVRTGAIGKPIAAPGANRDRKHPAMASNERGEVLLAWTEGTGWKKGGSLAWQLFNDAGQPLPTKETSPSIPAWDFATAVALENDFLVIS